MKKATLLIVIVSLAILGYAKSKKSETSTSINQAEQVTKYHMEMLRWQKDSPVQVISVTTSSTLFLSGVIILNTGNTTLREVQLGWVMENENTFAPSHPAFISNPVSVLVKPGEIETVRLSDWTTAEVIQFAKSSKIEAFIAKVGVISSRDDKGKRFAYNLGNLKRFQAPQEDARIEALYEQIDKENFKRKLDDLKLTVLNDSQNRIRLTKGTSASPLPASSFVIRSMFANPAVGTTAPLPNLQQAAALCCKNITPSNPPSPGQKTICSVGQGAQSCTISFCGNNTTCGLTCPCQTCSIVPDCGGL
jgi:hypothetical protein